MSQKKNFESFEMNEFFEGSINSDVTVGQTLLESLKTLQAGEEPKPCKNRQEESFIESLIDFSALEAKLARVAENPEAPPKATQRRRMSRFMELVQRYEWIAKGLRVHAIPLVFLH